MPWSRYKVDALTEVGGEQAVTLLKHDFMRVHERAYWTMLSTVFDCLNEDDAHFVGTDVNNRFDPNPNAANLVALRAFDYVFYREQTFGSSSEDEGFESDVLQRAEHQRGGKGTSSTFIALHDEHFVLAFVHRVTRYESPDLPTAPPRFSSIVRGTTHVTMDIRKISYKCCLPPSFPLREIIKTYHRGGIDLLEEKCTEERVAEWRCIVMPETMLDARCDGIAEMESFLCPSVNTDILKATVLTQRNVPSLSEFHLCMDIESIRTLLRFQAEMLLARNENINTYRINPFARGSDAADPRLQKAHRRKTQARLRKFIKRVTESTGLTAFLPASPNDAPPVE